MVKGIHPHAKIPPPSSNEDQQGVEGGSTLRMGSMYGRMRRGALETR